MRLRVMASSLICFSGRLLIMHRGTHKEVAPDTWGTPGGHVEPHEMNDPRVSALRELYEETGIREEQLTDYGLRYVVISTADGELRVYLDFVGEIAEEPVLPECDEGTLHWLTLNELMDKPMPPTMRALLEHYGKDPEDATVHMGVVTPEPFSVVWTRRPPGTIFP